MSAPSPVLCVHGIWDRARVFDALVAHLARRGCSVRALDLEPNDGSVGIAALAEQVAAEAARLLRETGAPRLDLVGFSMGALVCRQFLADIGLAARVRRFVSISGPHAGSWLAYFRRGLGFRDMRPGSALLKTLVRSDATLPVERVDVLWTPFDLMVLPARSALLPGARARRLPVLLHPWMLTDRRVISAVDEALSSP